METRSLGNKKTFTIMTEILQDKSPDLGIFRKLLLVAKEICHENEFGESVSQCIFKAKSKTSQLASLYLHEALLRGSRRAITELLDSGCEFQLTLASVVDYLIDITLTPDQILNAKREMDFLVDKEMVSNNTVSQIRNFISQVPIIQGTPEYSFSMIKLEREVADLKRANEYLETRVNELSRKLNQFDNHKKEENRHGSGFFSGMSGQW